MLKDFVSIAGPIGVSHIMTFSKSSTTSSVNMRLMRLPQGPTLHFRGNIYFYGSTQSIIIVCLVENYLLAREVLSAAKRPVHYQALFSTSPLVVMNGFNNSKKKELGLMQAFVENMFPVINVDTVILFE